MRRSVCGQWSMHRPDWRASNQTLLRVQLEWLGPMANLGHGLNALAT